MDNEKEYNRLIEKAADELIEYYKLAHNYINNLNFLEMIYLGFLISKAKNKNEVFSETYNSLYK